MVVYVAGRNLYLWHSDLMYDDDIGRQIEPSALNRTCSSEDFTFHHLSYRYEKDAHPRLLRNVVYVGTRQTTNRVVLIDLESSIITPYSFYYWPPQILQRFQFAPEGGAGFQFCSTCKIQCGRNDGKYQKFREYCHHGSPPQSRMMNTVGKY